MAEAEPFATHRPYFFTLAYQMLGSASDAEDVLQDAYLRYCATPRAEIRIPRAYISTIVTRLCLDRLKAARTTREQYIGPWLPEPLLTVDDTDIHQVVEQHEAITQAFLVLLETLTPPERAVFLLREVFEYPYEDIAAALQMSLANCRQLFHRAKEQIAAHRPRFSATPAQQQELVERFLAATQHGDVEALQSLLAADAELWADTGGNVPAPRKPVRGRERIAPLCTRFIANTARVVQAAVADIRMTLARVNNEPAILVWVGFELDTVIVFTVGVQEIKALRLIRNPEKLAFLRRQLAARAATS